MIFQTIYFLSMKKKKIILTKSKSDKEQDNLFIFCVLLFFTFRLHLLI